MERFIEKENIALFQRRLAEEPDPGRRRLLLSLLKQSQGRLALIEAQAFGAHPAASMPDPLAHLEGVEHELDPCSGVTSSAPTGRCFSSIRARDCGSSMPMRPMSPRR